MQIKLGEVLMCGSWDNRAKRQTRACTDIADRHATLITTALPYWGRLTITVSTVISLSLIDKKTTHLNYSLITGCNILCLNQLNVGMNVI